MRAKREFTLSERDSLALEALPDSSRALLQSAERGTSYKQLALDFNIPIGTVRSRINRARNRIEWHRQKAAIDAVIDAKARTDALAKTDGSL